MDTTQTGVSTHPEDAFQNLWESGAFDANGLKPDEAQKKVDDVAYGNEPDEPEIPQQAQDQTEPAPEPENDNEPRYQSIEDFLADQKIDPEDFKSLNVQVKIDGEVKNIPLSDVIKSYQLEGHVNNKSIQLSEQQKQFEAERNAARELMRQQVQQNAALSQYAQNMLNQEYARVDWNALKVNNPGEYAARMVEFQQRQSEINNYVNNVMQQQQALTQQQQMEMQSKLALERENMLNANPEWRDQSKFDADRAAMMKYAASLGYNEAELSQIYDHRLIRVLHDAARFAGLQANKPEALKKVRAAAPSNKPGTRNIRDPKSVQRQSVIERFNQNPRDTSAQEALFDLLAN